MTATIHVGVISHGYGDDLYAAATADDLNAKIAAYAGEWAEKEMGKPLPATLSDEDKIRAYFDHMSEQDKGEYCHAEAVEIPGYALVKLPDGEATSATVDDLIAEALGFEADAWTNDEDVNGGDMVEFFGEWRQRMAAALKAKAASA